MGAGAVAVEVGAVAVVVVAGAVAVVVAGAVVVVVAGAVVVVVAGAVVVVEDVGAIVAGAGAGAVVCSCKRWTVLTLKIMMATMNKEMIGLRAGIVSQLKLLYRSWLRYDLNYW